MDIPPREPLPGEVLQPDGVHSAFRCEICTKFHDIFGVEFYNLGSPGKSCVCHGCMCRSVAFSVQLARALRSDWWQP